MTESRVMTGAYTPFRDTISDEEKEIFNAAIPPIGATYEPLAVSTQVVAGINYRFFCNQTLVTPAQNTKPVFVDIYAPLPGQGKPHVTSIIPAVTE